MKFIFYSLFVVFSLLGNQEVVVIENEAKTPLLYPGGEKVETKKLQLPSGLSLFLVSDPSVPLDSASLTVFTGSFDDPKEFPGFAHFVEHLLFLGSVNYPEAGELDRFLAKRGGRTNAFTSHDTTTFFFSCHREGLEEALARFSDMLTCPLFPADLMEKEKRAVDEEFQKNLTRQDYLLYHLLKEASSSDHPFSRFSTGNLETLGSVNREKVVDWFSEHYRPDQMQLHVRSAIPLQELQEKVVRHFSKIEKREVLEKIPYPLYEKGLISPAFQGRKMIAPSKNESESLYIVFQVPKVFLDVPCEKPAELLAWLSSCPQRGALISTLKEKGLIQEASFSTWMLDASHAFFIAEFLLTKEGLVSHSQLSSYYREFLEQLREEGSLPHHYDEMKKEGLLAYQFSPLNPLEWGSEMGSKAKDSSFSLFPEPKLFSKEHDEACFQSLLDHLVLERPLTILSTPSAEVLVPLDKTVPWLKEPYAVVEEADGGVAEKGRVKVAKKNDYFPEQFALCKEAEWGEMLPECCFDEKRGCLYYSPSTLGYPHLYVSFLIKSPFLLAKGKKKQVLQLLYRKWLEELLTQEMEDAERAGLSLELSMTDKGILLRFSGFSDKQPLLFDRVVEKLTLRSVDPIQFQKVKEKLAREFSDFFAEPLYNQVFDYFTSFLFPNYPTRYSLRKTLDKGDYNSFAAFLDGLYTSVFVEGLIIGNQTKEEAKMSHKKLFEALSKKGYQQKAIARKEMSLKSLGEPHNLRAYTEQEGGGILLLAIEPKARGPKERALGELSNTLLRTSFFQELRTKQQTGYATFSLFQEMEGRPFHNFIIQSSTYSPEELRWRTEIFLHDYMTRLPQEVDEASFTAARNSLLDKYRKKAQTLSEFGARMERLAFSYQGEFKREIETEKALLAVTYPEFIDYCQKTFGRDNLARLSLEIIPKKGALFSFKEKSLSSMPYEIYSFPRKTGSNP